MRCWNDVGEGWSGLRCLTGQSRVTNRKIPASQRMDGCVALQTIHVPFKPPVCSEIVHLEQT